jgi:glycosyltransferase involved in cell wall biosynthesis
MKVLHVIPAIASCYGGPSKVVLDTCRALRSEGIDAEIATTNADGEGNITIPGEAPAIVDGVPVFYFERQYGWRYKFSWDLTKWLKANVTTYDLLHLHAVFSYSTSAAAFYARKYAVPYILLPHGMLAPWPVRKNWLLKKIYLKAIEQRNLERAAAVHFTAEEELQMSVVRGTSNFVLPCIVDFNMNQSGVRSVANSSRLQILFLSRIDPKKGIDILIDALRILAHEGREFDLVLAGSGDQKYEERVKTMIESAGLSPKTTIAGFVEGAEKANLLEHSDIFVLPSHHENFGIAVVEAMAAGIPVVISDRVNIHNEIREAKAGVVIPATVDDLTSALRRLMDSPALRKQIGGNGRQLVEERYSSIETVKELKQVYSDIDLGTCSSTAWRTFTRNRLQMQTQKLSPDSPETVALPSASRAKSA